MNSLFREAVARLRDFPKMGKVGQIPGTRELTPHESYRLVYEVDDAKHVVRVVALVHAAREWPPAG